MRKANATWPFVLLLLVWASAIAVVLYKKAMARKEHMTDIQASNAAFESVNAGDKPWQRHPVYDSIPLDVTPKYANAYYYELDNAAYEKALRQTFAIAGSACAARLRTMLGTAARSEEWTSIDPEQSSMLPVYDGIVVPTIQEKIRTSPFFVLPGDGRTPAPIQVVHDRWTACYRHKTEPNTWRFDLELVLYREAKFQAKHVELVCIVSTGKAIPVEQQQPLEPSDWTVEVLVAKVIGIVPEQMVAMHPVLPSQSVAVPQELGFDPNPYNFGAAIIMDDDEVIKAIRKREGKWMAQLQAEMKLS